MKLYLRIISFIFLINLYPYLHGYNLRQISSREGLSNSSVICLFQDSKRFLWIGTFDGLNMYDGRDIHIYKPDINNQNSLSGNVVRKIYETEGNYLWITTKWGLNKFSKRDNVIEKYYNEIGEDSPIICDSHDNLYVLGKNGIIRFYDKIKKQFIDIPFEGPKSYTSRINFFIDSNDTMRIVHNGVMEKYTVNVEKKHITRHPDFSHPFPIISTSYLKGNILFVDTKGDLSVIDRNGKVSFIKNILQILQHNGDISTVIYDDDDILIAFRTSGLVRLNARKNYDPEWIDINCGVFSLLKDEQQDIVWIGTDGQGLYAYTKDEYTFKGFNHFQLPLKEKKPIRAIQTDHLNDLWLGTKDNGIIRIKQYDSATDYSSGNVTHFTVKEGLSSNAVFVFSLSPENNILWIGSDGPSLNYYSYYDKKIYTLINGTPNKFKNVHSLLEESDSILWVASGSTLIKVDIQKRGQIFEAKSTRQFTFDIKNKQITNQVYSLYSENDSIMWVGMRGNGIIRLNKSTGSYKLITFDQKGVAPMNDILCIHRSRNGYFWIGSSYGLTRLVMYENGEFEYENYNENDGLANNTVHGILENEDGKLWLSTNTGIALFDPEKESFRNFNQRTGLKTIEFSDNAYFKDYLHSVYFFGGVDGLVWIKPEDNKKKEFIPYINFTKLRIFNKEYNINDFIKGKADDKYLELSYDQNFFTISFVAMDFINGANSRYSYKLENFSDIWMDTRSNEAQFTNITPGNYVLKVRYDDGTGNNSYIQSIHITVLPPWYMTVYAKIIYAVLIIGMGFSIYLYIQRRYRQKKAKIAYQMEQKYKEEMYEGKLRFFTNITHELSTPLTLIYGPSERILDYDGKDPGFIKKYAQIIRSNAERLNNLIQEIIDFRRMETGNKVCFIQSLDIRLTVIEISNSFIELSERNNISYETHVNDEITWNTDHGCFTKILTNLISNAFKYTPQGGLIKISAYVENNTLILKVHNTGKGIDEKDIPFIFNRYSVLDNIKENSIKGLSSRNGLGLAICQNMTELLQGKIEIQSEVNKYAEFIISLPYLDQSITDTEDSSVEDINASQKTKLPAEDQVIASLFDDSKDEVKIESNTRKARILVIEDNEEMLWMSKDLLSDEYDIETAGDGQIGFDMLIQSVPDLIITDIMMPNMDGISLIKKIKQNKHTVHIPLVILSAKTDTGDRIEGIESGADVYIPKPFDSQYLKTVVARLIKNKKSMEEYYNTSASAYNFSKGKLLLKEDKNFLDNVMSVIDKNISNSEFTPEELADKLQISVRNLYRKLKELDQLPPKDFIKEQRITYSAKLLVTTAYTVQEIMYNTGFTTRSHFYKEFTRRYNLSPKEYRDRNKQKNSNL